MQAVVKFHTALYAAERELGASGVIHGLNTWLEAKYPPQLANQILGE